MAEGKQPSSPGCLLLFLAGSLEKLGRGRSRVDKTRLGLCVGRQWEPGRCAGQLCTERLGRGVLPTPPSCSQWPLLGVSGLSMECSGGNGWGQLKEAPLQARALSSCRRRKHAFSWPPAWPRRPGPQPWARVSFISRACGHLGQLSYLTLLFLPSSAEKLTRSSETSLV